MTSPALNHGRLAISSCFEGEKMSIDSIKTHMNSHHVEELKVLVRQYGSFDPASVSLEGLSAEGLTILADGREVFAPFPSKTEEKDYKNAIIALCTSASKAAGAPKDDTSKLKAEIEGFKDSVLTIVLSTLSPEGQPNVSYASLLRYEGQDFIYISQVAEHYANLRANPSLQIMFIEDESKAKTILARKRLVYNATAEFLPRDDFFDKVYDSFEKKAGASSGVGQVRGMMDFHLVRLNLKDGRFVKGFGKAYNLGVDGSISHIGGGAGASGPHGNPHGGNPHGGGHGNPHGHPPHGN